MTTPATKFCNYCRTLKELTQFHKNKLATDGLQHHCKDCIKKHLAAKKAAKEKRAVAWKY